MRKHLYTLLLLFVHLPCLAQGNFGEMEKKMLLYFRKHSWDSLLVTRDNLYNGWASGGFNVSISRKLIEFDTARLMIRNPYFSEKYENGEYPKDFVRNFPRSYSVIFQKRLVSLFENGKFACFELSGYNRDTEFEKLLNTRNFSYHWIINGRLGAASGGKIFLWNGSKWTKSKDKFPLRRHAKLFEDDKFIVFNDCNGEFGGTLYFFEKASARIFFTESTCANTVTRNAQGYNILSSLGHGSGSAGIKLITDPTKLTLAGAGEVGTMNNGAALGYKDKSAAYTIKLDLRGIQLFSSFHFGDRLLYIVHLADLTFLAEIKGKEVEIVHPLFFDGLYTHNPVTSQYGEYTLVNLDFYGTGLYREVALLVIYGNKIVKVDWNEVHHH